MSSDDNSAILKAEYNLLNDSPAFNVARNQIALVQQYLTERMANGDRSYITHSNTDEKKRTTTTIILTPRYYMGQNARLEQPGPVNENDKTHLNH
jgi:hypothetical protein